MKMPNFADLFCGCGGFSLGMQRAGFKCLAAIDFNAEATAVFQKNFPQIPHALQKDLTTFPIVRTHQFRVIGNTAFN